MSEEAAAQKDTDKTEPSRPLEFFDIYWAEVTFIVTVGISILLANLVADVTTDTLIALVGITVIYCIGTLVVKGHDSIMKRLDQLESKE